MKNESSFNLQNFVGEKKNIQIYISENKYRVKNQKNIQITTKIHKKRAFELYNEFIQI